MAVKRILIVTSELVPFRYGGIGTQFKSLACLLKRHGYQVHLLARKPDNYDAALYRSHYGETPLFFVDVPSNRKTGPLQHFLNAVEVSRRFDEIYPEISPDLVIFADFNAEGLFLLLKSESGAYGKTEFLLTINGMNRDIISVNEGNEAKMLQGVNDIPSIQSLLAMEDLCIHLAPWVVSPTVCAWEGIRQRLGIHKTARIIPNLVDLDLFDPDRTDIQRKPREAVILFVGRLDRIKGADLLLKAYFEIADRMHPIIPQIIFIGRDCYWNEYGSTFLEYWKKRIPEKYINTISFLQPISHDLIRDYIKKATLCVFPSRLEIFGIVCLEAIAMGCPVVVSQGTGLVEVLGPELEEFAVSITEGIQPLVQKILSLLQMENSHTPDAELNYGYFILTEKLRKRALEVVRQAEAGWLDLLRDIHREERTEDQKPPLRLLCAPFYQLLISLEEASWKSTTQLQIYFRHQGGYTESDSLRTPYPRFRWTTLKIPLPADAGERPLRLDPANAPGVIRIKEIALLDEAGDEIWRCDSSNSFKGCNNGGGETMSFQDSSLVIDAKTDDPQLFLDCPTTNRPVKMSITLYAGDNLKANTPIDHDRVFDHYLSVCASIKNEGPYLLEWIEYHRMLGVEHFYIYDNNSIDDPQEILKDYIDKGIVEYKVWPMHPYGQIGAFKDCIQKYKDHSYWIGFIDIDEYIVPIRTETISDFLKKYEGSNGIGINWMIYGSSGHLKKPEGLTIENFIKHSETSLYDNKIIKSIVNPRQVCEVTNQHFFKFKDNSYVLDEDMEMIDTDSETKIHKSGKIRINHYFTRSHEEWEKKQMRGRTSGTIRPERFFADLDRNERCDDIMTKYVPELKKRIHQRMYTRQYGES